MKRRQKPKKKAIRVHDDKLPSGFKKGIKRVAKKKQRAESKNLTREY